MIHLLRHRAIGVLFVALLAGLPTTAFAQSTTERVHVDFHQVTLEELVRWVSSVTGRNIIFVGDELGQRRVTVVAPTPITADEVFDLFVAALSVDGMGVEVRENYVLIRSRVGP